MYLNKLLSERAASKRPVLVGLVGAGRFGTTVAAQLGQMTGIRLAAICDLREINARAALEATGADQAVLVSDHPATVAQAVEDGRPVWTTQIDALAQSPLEVVVEATGNASVAVRTALAAIENRKHIVMVTVEADVTVGSLLNRKAQEAGVVYTLADGDQPISTKRLVDWARCLGYRIVAAGRGTVYHPTDWDGRPEDAFARYGYDDGMVERRRLNAQMYNSFRDGSKAQIEMTALANMTGLVPDRRGMHEPSARIDDLARLFTLEEDGGLLSQAGVVDLANAVSPDGKTLLPDNIATGVWVIISTERPLLQEDLGFYHLPVSINGKYAAYYRNYHLCGIETPMSILEAVLLRTPTGSPAWPPVADVVTIAKHRLEPGDVLDGSGGATVRGMIDRHEVSMKEGLLPLSMSTGARMTKPADAGQPITYDMVEIDERSPLTQLRREQEGKIRQMNKVDQEVA